MLARAFRCFAEAGQVDGDRAEAGRCQRLELFAPHRPVGDAGVEKDDGRSLSDVVVGQHHAPPVKRIRARFESKGALD